MASQSGDRLLWLCLGVALFFAARGVAAELHRVRDLTEIKKGDIKEQVIGEATEETLKLDTLLKLSESSSFDLRSAALRIVTERATRGPARELLLEDLASCDSTRSRKALNAVHFLISSRCVSRSNACSRLKDVASFTALVDCLCNFLEEHDEETSSTESPILPRTRPPGENKALATLATLLPENLPAALEAGVVGRWLARYPFPCALGDESKRRNVSQNMKIWSSDDPIMCAIFEIIEASYEGEKHLRKYGLTGGRLEGRRAEIFRFPYTFRRGLNLDFDDEDSDSDVWMEDGEDTAGVRPSVGRRTQDSTSIDQALRRRRREAMVLSEGDRPLDRDNIIEPVRNDDDDDDYHQRYYPPNDSLEDVL